MPPAVTAAEAVLMARLRDEGHTAPQIAAIMGVSAVTVRKHAPSAVDGRAGNRRPRVVVPPAIMVGLVDAYTRGDSLRVVGRRVGVAPQTARRLLVEAGAVMRKTWSRRAAR
jgi:predicted transcriptional regulator